MSKVTDLNGDAKVVITEIRKDIKRLEDILRMSVSQQKTALASFQEQVEKTTDDHEKRLRASEKSLANQKGYIFAGIALTGFVVSVINVIFKVLT